MMKICIAAGTYFEQGGGHETRVMRDTDPKAQFILIKV